MSESSPNRASPLSGLTAAEAARRLSAGGSNVLPGGTPKPMFAIVPGVITEPMFLMLLVAGGIYLALGDRAEALFRLGFVFVVIGITLTQERKTQRASARLPSGGWPPRLHLILPATSSSARKPRSSPTAPPLPESVRSGWIDPQASRATLVRSAWAGGS